jgi:2-oxoglutarate dehydrogenase E1 component
LYKIIASHPDVSKIYSEQLINEGVLTSGFIESYKSNFENKLEKELENSRKSNQVKINRFFEREWKNIKHPDTNLVDEIVDTKVSKQILIELANKLLQLPADKKFVSKIEKLMSDRMKMLETNKLDWAMGEMLAFGTLLSEEINVRLSGQDSQRGTFSHRHSSLVIEDTDEKFFPLKNISQNQGKFSVFNSPLSEYGVLGYEYGYALTKPDALTIWEAQFGDFNNVAQVMIDQYISSAYEKWNIMNALVMLLPHGYEGQGPEHSSARVERFLTLCAKDNMFVANCSTPANFFHILRRQVKSSYRIPLIVFTPKSLLRHPECVSTMEELAEGNFHKIIDDVSAKAENVKQIAFCTGKIYYELDAKRKTSNNQETAIVRIEQLYPFPEKEFNEILKKYTNCKQIIWSQEEPENMGVWNFIQRMLPNFKFKLVARPAGGSPATGLYEVHNKMQDKILNNTIEVIL